MKGSQYIAKFLKAVGANKVFQVQGGAISFMVDAIYLFSTRTGRCNGS